MPIPVLSDLEHIVRQAGEILRLNFGTDFDINHKGVIDLVTEIDHRSESFILGEIQARFPDHRIISEESGEKAGGNCCLWFVDPLDGTVNYSHRVPAFTVSIAFQQEGVMRLGVVYDPLRDELFSAQKGEGAWLNGKPIRVSTAQQLDQSLLATGFAYDIRTHPETNLDHFTNFALRCQGVRRFGSAALDLCYVAAGRFDGFWELRLNSWDVAAGALIVAEAGGHVTDIHGEPDFLSPSSSILAANPSIHSQMLVVLNHAD